MPSCSKKARFEGCFRVRACGPELIPDVADWWWYAPDFEGQFTKDSVL